MPSQRIWLALALGADRQYAGNIGYADELESIYRYDSNVPNHRQMQQGDVLLLCDREKLLGLATIVRITSKEGLKELRRCPQCRTTAFKEREHKRPRYRCNAKHEFDTPETTPVECINYEAHFEGTFRPSLVEVPVREVRQACPRFNGQLSIQELMAEKLPHLARVLLDEASAPSVPKHVELQASDASEDAYTPDGRDERARVTQQIRTRRGQRSFRQSLRKQFNDTCAVTRCRLIDLLEAAHIHPYRGDKDNHPSNGLLLRADIHTLFDLDLLGIEPETRTVHLHPSARGMGYDQFEGVVLSCPREVLSLPALRSRWREFQAGFTGDRAQA